MPERAPAPAERAPERAPVPVELPADFEQRYGLIHPDHSGVDLPRLRRHHQRVVRLARRRIRQFEAENEHLRKRLIEVSVTFYGGGGAFYGQLGHGVDVGEDNPGHG